MTYQAYATPTTRGYHPSSQWQRHQDVQIATAETLPELKKKLADFYGHSWRHKKPMYRDTDKETVRCGWVVGRRMSEGRDKWLQQDWVSIKEIADVEW